MDVDLLEVGGDRLTGQDVEEAIAGLSDIDRKRLFAVACTAGTTNLGVIDDMQGIGEVCHGQDVWMHVDGAYGGAGLLPRAFGRHSTALNWRTVSSSTHINGYSHPLTAAP